MTNERIEAIRTRLQAATPGPWEWEGESKEDWPQSDNSLVTAYVPEGEKWREPLVSGWGYDASGISVHKDADGELIANAPTDIAYLLNIIDQVSAAMDELDTARAEGKVYTYGQIQRTIRDALTHNDKDAA